MVPSAAAATPGPGGRRAGEQVQPVICTGETQADRKLLLADTEAATKPRKQPFHGPRAGTRLTAKCRHLCAGRRNHSLLRRCLWVWNHKGVIHRPCRRPQVAAGRLRVSAAGCYRTGLFARPRKPFPFSPRFLENPLSPWRQHQRTNTENISGAWQKPQKCYHGYRHTMLYTPPPLPFTSL